MPLRDYLLELVESKVADLKNMGDPGGAAGMLTAGMFLKQFVGDATWAHLDIARPAFNEGGPVRLHRARRHRRRSAHAVRFLERRVSTNSDSRRASLLSLRPPALSAPRSGGASRSTRACATGIRTG